MSEKRLVAVAWCGGAPCRQVFKRETQEYNRQERERRIKLGLPPESDDDEVAEGGTEGGAEGKENRREDDSLTTPLPPPPQAGQHPR